jgi:hypothetical protein
MGQVGATIRGIYTLQQSTCYGLFSLRWLTMVHHTTLCFFFGETDVGRSGWRS